MTAEVDSVILDKCFAFCQALVQSNNHFTLKLSIGNVNFNFEHKKPEKSFWKKKKKSPSQVRREERRRQERAKVNDPKEAEIASVEKPAAIICSQCDFTSSSEEDLRTHIKSEHESFDLPTPEKERAPDKIAELELTPVQNLRNDSILTSPSPPSATSTATPPATEPPVYVCDRPHGRSRNLLPCGKTFKSEHDLRSHAHREHDYCYEHQVRYDVICPATDVRCRSQALAFNYKYHP